MRATWQIVGAVATSRLMIHTLLISFSELTRRRRDQSQKSFVISKALFLFLINFLVHD